jgi:hypothetical protein
MPPGTVGVPIVKPPPEGDGSKLQPNSRLVERSPARGVLDSQLEERQLTGHLDLLRFDFEVPR